MRTLILMRHAKSSWTADLADHERPLNKRGAKDAPRMAAYLEKRGWLPDLVLCSDAVRTRATLVLMLGAVEGWKPHVRFEPRLYLAEPPAILEVVAQAADDVQSCMVLGHNPGIHALSLGLVGSGDGAELADLAMKFPTAGVAALELPVDSWQEIEPGRARLLSFCSPRTV